MVVDLWIWNAQRIDYECIPRHLKKYLKKERERELLVVLCQRK